MKMFKKFRKIALIALVSIVAISCSDDDGNTTPANNTIVAIASNNANFSILVDALEKANLAGTLNGSGPLTVFAPTNEAFLQFLEDNDFESLDDVPTPLLTQVLLNHVVSGNVRLSQLNTGYISTLATSDVATGQNLNMYVSKTEAVNLNGGSALPGGATVTTFDLIASNGVIHVIDKVIALPTVVTFALADPTFEVLVQALTREDQPDFAGILSGEGPFTVFAPTNDAFVSFLEERVDFNTLADIPQSILTQTLQYHVVSGNVRSSQLTQNQEVPTLQGSEFTVDLVGGAKITDTEGRVSNVIAVDVQANNGVVHVLDKVILPSFN
jgi:uncharacterized surface protein with fasciclin (FAS1) repeats